MINEGKKTMVCTSKVMAERVAKYGAEKMDATKYQIKGAGFKNLIGKSYTVINRESGKKYSVSVDRPSCSCKFYQSNKEYKTCKHIVRCEQEAADEARYDEIEKAMAEAWGEGGED
jgi:hypothetical protein